MPPDHPVVPTPIPGRYSAADPRDVPVPRRLAAAVAVQEERVERLLELQLGKRALVVEVARTEMHPPALRISVLGPPPPRGSTYRRHEDAYLRSAAELDALVDALARARARLRELDDV